MSRDRFLFTVFFISGFCGLLYQIVWLRMALASFGVITPVISVVVSVFMLGLSLGSWLGGKWVRSATARTGRSALLYYGGIELGIGAGAFVVPLLFSFGENALLKIGESSSVEYLVGSATAITVSILPWCIFMGATFPAMMAFVEQVDDAKTSSFSFLYVANVFGAACGAALTAIALVEMLGFSMTLRLGAALNLGIALACVLVGEEYSAKKRVTETALESYNTETPDLSPPTSRLALVILFLTGFASMAMEVVWTRAFTPVMTTTIYAFASLLVTYLVATWLGSVNYRKDLRVGATMPSGQLMGYLAASSFLPILLNDPRLRPHPFIVCISIAPLCGLLGYLTPRLIDEYSSGHPEQAGRMYAMNILGCILGPLVAGYIMLPQMGVRQSLVLLSLPFVVLFFITFKSWVNDNLQRNVFAGAVVLLLALSIGWSKSMEDKEFYKNAEVRRDYTATVISDGEGSDRQLIVNGRGMTGLTPICKLMAHWPAVHLPNNPKNVLAICFGMGTTFRSAMSWNADVYAAELVPSVRDAFGFYFHDAEDLLKSPKAHVNIDDGRRFLKRTTQKFDIITVDPPPPVEAAGSSLLYSGEFYEAIKARLSDSGILQQWYPLPLTPLEDTQLIGRIAARSIAKSFPYVRVFGGVEGYGLHFLASMKPIPVRTAAELASRIPPAARDDLVEWYRTGTRPEQVFAAMLAHEYEIGEVVNPDKDLYLSDDQPFNEYYLLRRYFHYPYSSRLAPAIIAMLLSGVIGALIVFRPRRLKQGP
jgi:spermidine synthase